MAGSFMQVGRETNILMQALRAHMTADMLHDSLRGVVFRALYGGVTQDRAMSQSAIEELAEYGGAFRDAIAREDALDLPEELRLKIETVATPLTPISLAPTVFSS